MGDMTVDELKSKKLWFLWSAKPGKNGKVTKVPFAANGGATGTDDAHKGTWVSFNAAKRSLFPGNIFSTQLICRSDIIRS